MNRWKFSSDWGHAETIFRVHDVLVREHKEGYHNVDKDGYFEKFGDVHWQTFIKFDCLPIVLGKEEFVAPVETDIVKESYEVEDWKASTVGKDYEDLDQEIGEECWSINFGSCIEILQIVLQYFLGVALSHLGL